MDQSHEGILGRSQIEFNTGCWLWTGTLLQNGYPVVSIKGRAIKVHRLSLAIKLMRPLSDGELACHRCDTPSCVNPDHLFAGSHRDNSRDSRDKGRNYVGEKNPRAKLKAADIQTILNRLNNGEAARAVGRDYGVSKSLINALRRGEIWKHLGGISA